MCCSMSAAYKVFHAQGQVSGAVVVARDVTARRGLERRTHQALDALLAMAERCSATSSRARGWAAGPIGRPAAQGVAQRLVELTSREVLGCTSRRDHRHRATDRRAASLRRGRPLAGARTPLVGPNRASSRSMRRAARPRTAGALPGGRGPAGRHDHSRRFRDLAEPLGIRTLLGRAPAIERRPPSAASPWIIGGERARLYAGGSGPDRSGGSSLAALVIERERLLRERAEAQASELALREVNRRMDEFLSIAAHELRTPLTSIRGSLQLASAGCSGRWRNRRGRRPPATRAHARLLRRADDQTGRLTRMMADLLDVARIRARPAGGAAGAVRLGRPGAALCGRGATRLAGPRDPS